MTKTMPAKTPAHAARSTSITRAHRVTGNPARPPKNSALPVAAVPASNRKLPVTRVVTVQDVIRNIQSFFFWNPGAISHNPEICGKFEQLMDKPGGRGSGSGSGFR
jgi:hypothetical protein